jgi:hypothetical protein
MLSVEIKTALTRVAAGLPVCPWLHKQMQENPDLLSRLAVETVSKPLPKLTAEATTALCLPTILADAVSTDASIKTGFTARLCRQFTHQFPHRSRPVEMIATYTRRLRLFCQQQRCLDVAVATLLQQALEIDGEAKPDDAEHVMTKKLLILLHELLAIATIAEASSDASTTTDAIAKVMQAAFEQLFLRSHEPQIVGNLFFVIFATQAEGFVRRLTKMVASDKVDVVRRRNGRKFLYEFVRKCPHVSEASRRRALGVVGIAAGEGSGWQPFLGMDLLGEKAKEMSVNVAGNFTSEESGDSDSEMSEFFEFSVFEFMDFPEDVEAADEDVGTGQSRVGSPEENAMMARVLNSKKFKAA